MNVPFELRPDLPEEGISAKAYGLDHSEKVEEYLVRVAGEEGVPFVPIDLIPNTHKAMLMSELARDRGMFEAVHRGIFHAYYAESEDIGNEAVLLRVAEETGLDPAEVVETWSSGKYEERLHSFYHLALDLGVTATPSALICNELMIGSRPYGVLRDSVARCLLTQEDAEREVEPSEGALEEDTDAPE